MERAGGLFPLPAKKKTMSEAPKETRPPVETGDAGTDKKRGQLYRSIFRHSWRDTLSNRIQAIVGNVWLHLHPVRVFSGSIRLRFTLCAGGISFLLFLVTILTGLLLMFHYCPSTHRAHADVVALGQVVPFGDVLRSMHRYAGDGMIILVFVHLIRVFLTGSYKPPREFNWVVGVALLFLTLAIAFTGYLLPWDQKGYWATTVATNMVSAVPFLGADGPAALVSPERDLRTALLGGPSVGPPTLIRFYVLHCIALPLGAALLMALHFWRVRKDGISRPL
jgi:quinol-cytochrome oxidoreductase complex cytochrome b subunit